VAAAGRRWQGRRRGRFKGRAGIVSAVCGRARGAGGPIPPEVWFVGFGGGRVRPACGGGGGRKMCRDVSQGGAGLTGSGSWEWILFA